MSSLPTCFNLSSSIPLEFFNLSLPNLINFSSSFDPLYRAKIKVAQHSTHGSWNQIVHCCAISSGGLAYSRSLVVLVVVYSSIAVYPPDGRFEEARKARECQQSRPGACLQSPATESVHLNTRNSLLTLMISMAYSYD